MNKSLAEPVYKLQKLIAREASLCIARLTNAVSQEGPPSTVVSFPIHLNWQVCIDLDAILDRDQTSPLSKLVLCLASYTHQDSQP